MPTTLRRGNVIKKVRLINIPEEVECRIGKSQVVLKAMYLKKA